MEEVSWWVSMSFGMDILMLWKNFESPCYHWPENRARALENRSRLCLCYHKLVIIKNHESIE